MEACQQKKQNKPNIYPYFQGYFFKSLFHISAWEELCLFTGTRLSQAHMDDLRPNSTPATGLAFYARCAHARALPESGTSGVMSQASTQMKLN